MTMQRANLAEKNMNLARYVAHQFKDTGLSYEDLEGIAFLGLTKAAIRFDESKSSFSTYAVPTIRNEILQHLRKKTVNTVSMDEPIAEGVTLADTLGSACREIENAEDKVFLEQSMKLLSPEEREVLICLYWRNCLQSEVAKRLGCSQSRVSKIHGNAISKLRRAGGFGICR